MKIKALFATLIGSGMVLAATAGTIVSTTSITTAATSTAQVQTLQTLVSTLYSQLVTQTATVSLSAVLSSASAVTSTKTVTYAQGMGTTDTDGLVKTLPLKPDDVARRVWVDAVNGSDANNGFSPTTGCKLNGSGTYGQIGATACKTGVASGYGPKKTYMAAVRLFKQRTSDLIAHQILLGQGDTFVESEDTTLSDDLVFRNGESAQYPRVVESYDKSDPLNEWKYGRAAGSNRPKLKASVINKGLIVTLYTYQTGANVGNVAVRGLELVSSNGQPLTISMVNGSPSNILIENVVGSHLSIAIGGQAGAKNVILRKSSLGWTWDYAGAHVGGVWTSYISQLVVEDCIIYHGGWMTNRDAKDGTGADIYRQNYYASYGSTDQTIIRRNVTVDAAASGLSGRGSVKAYHNVMIDNPVQGVAGGSVTNYSVENPTGVDFNYDHNLVMGGADINSTTLRGQGFSLQNGRKGSTANYNLFVNGHQPTLSYAYVFQAAAAYNQPSYVEIKGNRVYAFSKNFDLNDIVPSAYPKQVFTTKGTVQTSAAAAAATDNVNSTTSPATNLQIYTAAGYPAKDEATAKAALVADMVANPDQPWAYRLMRAAAPLFGKFDFALEQ